MSISQDVYDSFFSRRLVESNVANFALSELIIWLAPLGKSQIGSHVIWLGVQKVSPNSKMVCRLTHSVWKPLKIIILRFEFWRQKLILEVIDVHSLTHFEMIHFWLIFKLFWGVVSLYQIFFAGKTEQFQAIKTHSFCQLLLKLFKVCLGHNFNARGPLKKHKEFSLKEKH